MTTLATTRMSTRGQVVIPESIRRRLDLKPGTEFVVVGDADAVLLKPVDPPALGDFPELLREARKQARRAGLKRSDIAAAVREVRARR